MKALALILVVTLSGCAGFSAVKTTVAIEGAKAADEALRVSEWGVCEATTVGAWKRKFGQNHEKADAWRKLCSDNAVAPIE